MATGDSPQPYVLVVCPTCRTRLHPRRELLGKRVRCPDCGVPVRVVERTPQSVAAVREKESPGEYRLSETDQPVVPIETVAVTCPTCGTKLHPRVALVGKRVRCPDCRRPVTVPEPREEKPIKAPPRPAGAYGIGAAPEPIAMPETVLQDLDRTITAPPPEPAPRLWFVTGVFGFPWYPGTISRWMILTLFLLFANTIVVFGGKAIMGMVAGAGAGDAYATAFKVALSVALGMIVWTLTMAYIAGCVVTVIRDTAAGNNDIEDWSDTEITEGFLRSIYLWFPLVAAGAVCYGIHYVTAMFAPEWAVAVSSVALLVLFPIFFVSALEHGSALVLVSPTALRLISGFWWGWLLLYVEVGLVTGGWAGLSWLGLDRLPYVTALLGAPVLAAVIFIDARLLGRFLLRAAEVVEERRALREEQENVDAEEEHRARNGGA
ncbi:MAG: hypothetical protein HYX69_11565 [Planctomycetia bacterium]|nr:hypothetical protein [Planctomycetia bacterium]